MGKIDKRITPTSRYIISYKCEDTVNKVPMIIDYKNEIVCIVINKRENKFFRITYLTPSSLC